MSRRVLVLAHTGRMDAVHAAGSVRRGLIQEGLIPVMLADELAELDAAQGAVPTEVLGDSPEDLDGIEVGMVLGGDGTILRAAEIVRESSVPLLGVNLGHVGFLAESEREDLDLAVRRVAAGHYTVEERMTLDVQVYVDGSRTASTWAVNEATVEKAGSQRMLEIVLEVDGQPLSTFGCDGVVLSTPTGSTAYGFSAGGPVVWPAVEALLMVPLSAHALFSRPLVVAPTSVLAVELLQRTDGSGVLWCDGRRTVPLPPGARVEVRRSDVPVRLARLSEGTFTERLVAKFQLPVTGWRGPESTT
ncbi:NAD kinase [Spelaeicoccus albus]|uniref:NAD kinase n=1 Tax=Spelaeicoccus albus TaxID=1280376 RepID=A0A7Z0IJ61_9MICO|nr:NAD kinase [Spelaeicoccus albus]NYI69096.1 NAD+ kinase [Spelaeicoccus albus]